MALTGIPLKQHPNLANLSSKSLTYVENKTGLNTPPCQQEVGMALIFSHLTQLYDILYQSRED